MPLAEIPGALVPLWHYWIAKRGRREMPERSDIDPAEIPALIPHLSLFEVVDGRFQFRIAGRFIVETYGVEPRGKYLDELLPAERGGEALRGFRMVLERRRPVLTQIDLTTPSGAVFPLTRLLLPLARSGTPVGYVLAGLAIEKLSRTDAAPLGPGTTAKSGSAYVRVLEDK